MFDTTLSFLVTSMARYLFTGTPARRVGNRHPLSAPFGVYKAKDGHFALAVLNLKLFKALAGAMGLPVMGEDDSLATDEQRSAREPELRAAIEAWAAGHSVDEVVAIIEQAGVPVAPIWNIGQALESPQAVARNLLQPVGDERLPGMRLPVQPVRFGGAAPSQPTRAPALGEHTEDVLATLLDLSLEKISELKAAGVMGISAHPSSSNANPSHKE